ncbi:2TM domain-containing protein [Motilimonas cestriensis]|uniref:2TM domain-containing protein n=2 Tax=Motilimonas cestriensis TaxID=2742685 RepID=A0ABS8WF55_9GAMM|nr:2TM domain-containing protein [Motilimonas cestriensis]
MNTSHASEPQDPEAIKLAQAKAEVQELKGFYAHLSTYALVMLLLTAINLFFSPDYLWVLWPMMGWGIAIINHALGVFNIWPKFGKDWEEKQIQKRLKK